MQNILYQDGIIISKFNGNYKKIKLAEISYFEIYKKKITVHYISGQENFYCSLKELEDNLETRIFCKINRSEIINTTYILTFSRSKVTLTDGTVHTVGRQYSEKVMENLI